MVSAIERKNAGYGRKMESVGQGACVAGLFKRVVRVRLIEVI